MSQIRPFRHLAELLKLSERQFHRRLNDGCPEAQAVLRSEVVYVVGATVPNLSNDLNAFADTVKRCDPELAKMAEAMGRKLVAWLDSAPPNKFRIEHDKRLTELCDHPLISDERYEEIAADLSQLPPTAKEIEALDDAALAGLKGG